MRDRPRKRDGSIVAGLILIAIGTAFLLEQIGLGDFGELVARYWPMILVVIGFARFAQPHRRHRGIWLIGIGSWLQVSNIGLWGLHWGRSWPLLLVVIGACIVLETLVPERQLVREDSRDTTGEPGDRQ